MERDQLKTAVILAGGLGERLKPLTDKTPKPLLLVKGKPIIQYAIENLKKYGILDIVLSIGYMADKIQDNFGDGKKLGVNIIYSVEKEMLGTGGAFKFASRGLGRFVGLNGDNLADFDYNKMLDVHLRNKAKLTLTLFPVEDVTKFGIVELDGERIVRFIEKPSVEDAPSNLNNAGATIFEPGVLDILPAGKSSIEYDCYEKLAPKGVVYAYIHKGQWFPTDDMEKYKKAEEEFKQNED